MLIPFKCLLDSTSSFQENEYCTINQDHIKKAATLLKGLPHCVE
jgi:hypothetical protein